MTLPVLSALLDGCIPNWFQVRDFVDRYMPAYKAYLPGLYSKGPTTARPGHVLTIAINERRGLAAEQPQQFWERSLKFTAIPISVNVGSLVDW